MSKPEVVAFEIVSRIGTVDQILFRQKDRAEVDKIIDDCPDAERNDLIRLTDHETERAADKARIAELEKQLNDPFRLARHSKRYVEQLREEKAELLGLLRLCAPVMRAHAGASHLTEGFNQRRNSWDDLCDHIKATLAKHGEQP